jgi:fructokinase
MGTTRTTVTRVPKVVGTGLISLDVVMGSEPKSAPGLYAGGTCGNVLAILAFFGWDAYPVARLGADKLAGRVRRDLRRWEVHCDYLNLAPHAPTPVIFERINADGSHRFSVTCPECGHWFPSYRPVTRKAIECVLEDLRDADVFFFDRASPGAIMLAEACRQSGACVIFEPSSVGDPAEFRRAVGVSDIVKYSCDRMSSLAEIGEIPKPLIEIGTLGSDGLQVRCRLPGAGRGWHKMPALGAPKFRDAAGAGDWLTATIIEQLEPQGLDSLSSLPFSNLVDILRYGQAASAWNCAYESARGGMYAIERDDLIKVLDAIVSGVVDESSAIGEQVPPRQRFAASAVCFSCGDPPGATHPPDRRIKRVVAVRA